MLNNLPSGTITFLFTDIEGSTQLWERYPDAMQAALAWHDELLRRAIESHHGRVVKSTGDGCMAAFASAAEAVAAIIDIQRALQAGSGPPTPAHDGAPAGVEPSSAAGPVIRIRAGLHTGQAERRDDDYYGTALNRAARIMSVGHGGQVLLSAATAALISDSRPVGVSLRDLGEHRLRDLSRPEHLFQLAAEGLPVIFPPLKSLDAFPGNLPVQLTTFVGRERELAEVKRLLTTTRLLTLTGPGGSGKTRLSLQAAADVQTDFTHGAWLVELAPLVDPALVPGAVAALFNLAPPPGLPLMAALTDYLRGKHLLLILDNCEHLVDACARLAADLLPACPRLTLLASSREGLGIAGETTFHVPTLGLPEDQDTTAAAVCRHDATDLFLQRARAVRPDFAITDRNAAAVGQIVRRLDGIPLAIELAAARVRLLAPEQIAARLDDRFRLLTGGSRTALPRQQTLHALVDWSHDLLSTGEATLFRRLGVFAGGWTLAAAEDVTSGGGVAAGEVLDLLSGLINKSLVVVDESEGQTRYHFLETIRQYAREKLLESGEDAAVHDRHAAYYEKVLAGESRLVFENGVAAFTSEVWLNVIGGLKSLESEGDNLRAALDWALGHAPERALLIAAQLHLGMLSAGGRSQINQALIAVENLPPAGEEAIARRRELRLMGHLVLGSLAVGEGDNLAGFGSFGRVAQLAREGGNLKMLACALSQRAVSANFMDNEVALTDAEAAIEVFQELGDWFGVGEAYSGMAMFQMRRGNMDKARTLVEQSRAALKRSGHPLWYGIGFMTASLFAVDGMAEAEAFYRAGIVELDRLGNRFFLNVARSNLGHLLRRQGRYREALDLYHVAIREWNDLGGRAAVANMLENYAFIARAESHPQRAARLLGAAEAVRDTTHADMTPWERTEYEGEVAALRDRLPPGALAAEWAAGRGLSLDEAVDFAVDS